MKRKIFRPALLMTLVALIALAVSFVPSGQVKAASWVQGGKLTASDGAAGDIFGSSVAVNGSVAVAGAPYKNGVRGAAYVYRYNGSAWVQEAKLTASDGAAGDGFGWAVAISGSLAVVGAPYNNGARGAAYVFRYSGSAWVQEQKLTAGDGIVNDYFGQSVAIDGNLVVVGAPLSDPKGSNSGAAYIFRYTGSAWVQEQKLAASDGAPNDYFGGSVAISGSAVVVGAYYYSNSAKGSAYVFRYNGSTWLQEAKLTASDGYSQDYFGISVAISGSVVVVGAPYHSARGTNSGEAYVFRYSGSAWSQEKKLIAGDGAAYDYFGQSVAISGSAVAVGAYCDDDKGQDSGSAYVFRYNGTWVQEKKLTASDGALQDYFGISVAMSSSAVVVGAYLDDDKGSNSGSAYVFSSTNAVPTAGDESYYIFAGATNLVESAPGVLGNDYDADGDSLAAVQVSNPAHGTLVFNADGSFIYTPKIGYYGADKFTYKVYDGLAYSNIANVNITVKQQLLVADYIGPVGYRFGLPNPGYKFSGTILDAWMNVCLKNSTSGDIYSVVATITSYPANVTLVDNIVYFSYIASGTSTWSTDTYEIKTDTSKPAGATTLIYWKIEYYDTSGGYHVINNVPQIPQ